MGEFDGPRKDPVLRVVVGGGSHEFSEDDIFDPGELNGANAQVTVLLKELFTTTRKLNDLSDDLANAELRFKKAWHVSYMEGPGGEPTATARKIYADLQCEHLSNTVSGYKLSTEKLERWARFLRDNLRALETISNNLRQQIKVTTL